MRIVSFDPERHGGFVRSAFVQQTGARSSELDDMEVVVAEGDTPLPDGRPVLIGCAGGRGRGIGFVYIKSRVARADGGKGGDSVARMMLSRLRLLRGLLEPVVMFPGPCSAALRARGVL